MPLYEYHCSFCNLTFEMLDTLSEASKKKPCPDCGGRSPRIVSAFAVSSTGNGSRESGAATVAQKPRDPQSLGMKPPQIPLGKPPPLPRYMHRLAKGGIC